MASGRSLCQAARQLNGGTLPRYGTPMGKEDTERARRLAEALRENLRRRKAQARALPDRPEPAKDEPEF